MPRIGLLSDSHGRSQTTRLAADLLVRRGAQLLLHLGDIGSVEVIDAIAGLADAQGNPIPARIVFGNTDWDADSLARYALSIDVAVDHPAGVLAVEPGDPQAGELLFTHGDDPRIMADALARQVKYLCHGHTHRVSDHRQGATRVINPGALFRAQAYTVAILDTQADEVTFLPLAGP